MGKFEVYSASAGAGKTYTLVKNYLKICLDSENNMKFREILAITFTNKAANEMKERIVEQLKEFSEYTSPRKDPDKSYGMLLQLAEEIGVAPEKLSYRARDVLSNILHNYSAFSVSTIDKFTNRLIRSFAQDLKLSSNYEVELDSGEMLSEAIDRMLADLEENSTTSEVLLQFINTKLDEGKSPRPEMNLQQMGYNLFNEGAMPFLKKLRGLDTSSIMQAGKKMKAELVEMEDRLKKQALQLMELIKANGIEKMDFSGGHVYNFINYYLEGRVDKWAPGKMVLKGLEPDASFYAKAKAKTLAFKFDPIELDLRNGLQLLVESFQELFPRYHLIDRILRDIYSLATLAEIESNLELVKEETNRLPIGEFNKLISEKLDKEPTAYLYEKLGDRYHFFFIDEFQDTSVLQWKNLLPLINNAMASSGSVMIVGDGKQSIYRWRGGEVSQFINLCNDADPSNKVAVGEQLMELYPRYNINLGSNYRSRKNVVEFNNEFFTLTGKMLEGEHFQVLYNEASQNVERQEGGYVYLKRFSYDKQTYEEQQCRECLRIIRDAVKRNYSLSDITIITRRKQESALLADFLVKENIAVVSPDSLEVSQSSGVRALVSFLKFLVRPDDLEGRWEFLNALWSQPAIQARFDEKHLFLDRYIHQQALQVHHFLEEHIEAYNYAELLKLSLGDKIYRMSAILKLEVQGNPFLHTFLDQAVDYQNKKQDGEAGFIRWWEEKGCTKSINLPAGVEAVNLMTVHKSKGLEFPVTIVPFADWLATREPMGSSTWMEVGSLEMHGLPVARVGLSEQQYAYDVYRQLHQANKENVYLDNLNLAYVAFTRAVDELYVLSARGIFQEGEKLTRYISSYFETKGLDPECIEIGSRGVKEAKNQEKVSGRGNLMEYASVNWFDKLRVSVDAPLNWKAGEGDQASYGKKVHSLMSKITDSKQVDSVLARELERGNISSDEYSELLPVIQGLTQDPVLVQYFEEGLEVFNEEEILIPGNISARPDRVVRKGDKLHIIDYKTGVPLPVHQEQVNGYRLLLQEMGYPDGDNVLVYLAGQPEVVKW